MVKTAAAEPACPFYRPLTNETKVLRLIKLCAESHEDQLIRCELQEPISLTESENGYEAVSYCWGSTLDQEQISVNGSCFRVTRNLYSALRRLQPQNSSDEARLLWIDAISINQADNEERSHLVRLMSDIYRNARRVIVDLGDERDDSDKAMQLIEMISVNGINHNKISELYDRISYAEWDTLAKLLSRPYWRRVWIVQEVAVARAIVVLCGLAQMSWSVFGRAVDIMVQNFLERGYFTRQKIQNLRLDGVWAVRKVNKLFLDGGSRRQACALAELLIICNHCESSDPRDQVYGLLSLSQETRKIRPDYRKSETEVFAEATRIIIAASGSLDIFSALDYQNRTQDSELPSWAPNFATHSPPNLPFYRLGYRAAGSLLVNEQTTRFENNEMVCQGHFAGTILETSSGPDAPLHMRANVLTSRLSPYRTDNERLLALFETLPMGFREDLRETMRLLEAETRSVTNNSDIFLAWYYRRFLEEGECPWNVEQSAPGWSSITKGRKFFTSVDGYIGLVPDAAEPGDHLVVLPGGRVPFCIREVEDISSKDITPSYHIIGDCYVHGLMRGEGLSKPRVEFRFV